MDRIAVVTGAGSGVGQAVVVRLARVGWRIVAVGRREATLRETAQLCGDAGSRVEAFPCDVADAGAVAAMARHVLDKYGACHALVNSAGTNVPKRKLEELSVPDYDEIVAVNLNGTFYCVREFLPAMREQQGGTIVNVISDAGIWGNAFSGAAYIASKFGATGLTTAINAEERKHGIRACGIFPGEIDTPLLAKRPTQPTPEHRARMLKADDVAECVMLAINLPDRAVVEQLVVRPR